MDDPDLESVYDRRQASGNWPRRGRWNPDELPPWYRELLGDVCASLTAWRQGEPGNGFPASCDPRRERHGRSRRDRHACE